MAARSNKLAKTLFTIAIPFSEDTPPFKITAAKTNKPIAVLQMIAAQLCELTKKLQTIEPQLRESLTQFQMIESVLREPAKKF